MKKSSLRTVKEKNRRLILRALLTEGGLSRIELAKQTGLSPSTITALVGELLAEGVVQESGLRAATAGRSRAGLTICPDYGRVVVVDIGPQPCGFISLRHGLAVCVPHGAARPRRGWQRAVDFDL